MAYVNDLRNRFHCVNFTHALQYMLKISCDDETGNPNPYTTRDSDSVNDLRDIFNCVVFTQAGAWEQLD